MTPVKPLIPLLQSADFNSTNKCNFTMKTVPWAMAWVPSLNIRLVNKIEGNDYAKATLSYPMSFSSCKYICVCGWTLKRTTDAIRHSLQEVSILCCNSRYQICENSMFRSKFCEKNDMGRIFTSDCSHVICRIVFSIRETVIEGSFLVILKRF